MSSKSQTLITVQADRVSLGVWDTRSGGETTAALSKYRPGGGGEVLDSVPATQGDVTVTRRFDAARDNDLVKDLRTRVGRAVITISEQPLDDDGVKLGKPTTWSGKLSSITADDADSNSDDNRMVTLVAVITKVA